MYSASEKRRLVARRDASTRDLALDGRRRDPGGFDAPDDTAAARSPHPATHNSLATAPCRFHPSMGRGSGGRGEVIRATAHAVLKNVFIAFYPLVRPQCQRVSSGRRSRYGSSDRAVRTVAGCAAMPPAVTAQGNSGCASALSCLRRTGLAPLPGTRIFFCLRCSCCRSA